MNDQQKERLEAMLEAERALSNIAAWLHDLTPTRSRVERRAMCLRAVDRLLKVRQAEIDVA